MFGEFSLACLKALNDLAINTKKICESYLSQSETFPDQLYSIWIRHNYFLMI
ncbi:hypothetical protein GCM10010833_02760 [Blastomonas aquatica]|uniref:HEPN domain-containing protein n=1 Tax=Blastomonas aquatica TaxID=1510276 RepID=A0ABQ1IVP6_9SPHN|nr:hypothetical protein GCM10010833_02760 [Blastomonas aquatica]